MMMQATLKGRAEVATAAIAWCHSVSVVVLQRLAVRGLKSTSTIGVWLRHTGESRRREIPVPVA